MAIHFESAWVTNDRGIVKNKQFTAGTIPPEIQRTPTSEGIVLSKFTGASLHDAYDFIEGSLSSFYGRTQFLEQPDNTSVIVASFDIKNGEDRYFLDFNINKSSTTSHDGHSTYYSCSRTIILRRASDGVQIWSKSMGGGQWTDDNNPMTFSIAYYDGNLYFIWAGSNGINYVFYDGVCTYNFPFYIYQSSIEGSEISPEAGTPSGEGGYTGGGFDDSSDVIGVPDTPAIGVTNVGFVNVYNPTQNGLQNLGADLFPDFSWEEPPTPSGSDIIDAVNALAQGMVNISKNIPNAIDMYINSNLVNYIIDCHVLPVAPAVGSTQAIKVGFKTFTQTAPRVTSDYIDFDCGTLSISEYYHNFMDYQTRARLYLPFVGFVPIQPELFQDGTLQVKYRFNVIDGSFMAFVLSTSSKSKLSNTVVGSYGGNACIHIPITGVNYSNMVSGIVSGAGAAVSALSGNVGGAVTSALNTLATKPEIQTSNAYNASTAFLGVRTPYLLIERPVSNFPRNYASESGIPSNITVDFSTLHGLTIATRVHLDGILCTAEEKTLLQDALAAGVIL